MAHLDDEEENINCLAISARCFIFWRNYLGRHFQMRIKISYKNLILEGRKAEKLNKNHCAGEQVKNDPYYLHGLI